MTAPRLCVVDRRRELPDHRPQVCELCEERMDGQLRMLEKGAPLLAVVAQVEPTASGHCNLDAVDLTLPGNPVFIGDAVDQTGHIPAAKRLAQWAEDWSRRDIVLADTSSVAQFLRRSLRWACASYGDVDVFARDLRQLYAAVKVNLHRNLSGHRYGTPCGQCGEKTLVRYAGADWIECKACRALYDTNEYIRLAIEDAEATCRATFTRNQPISAREAALLAGVTYDTVRQWASRGKIWADIGPWGGRRYLRIVVDWAQADIENRDRALVARRERIAA